MVDDKPTIDYAPPDPPARVPLKRLWRPPCPHCGAADATLDVAASNFLRLAAAVAIAFVFAEVVPLRWKCRRCGDRFLAVGQRPMR